jgi:hypothetical protein
MAVIVVVAVAVAIAVEGEAEEEVVIVEVIVVVEAIVVVVVATVEGWLVAYHDWEMYKVRVSYGSEEVMDLTFCGSEDYHARLATGLGQEAGSGMCFDF